MATTDYSYKALNNQKRMTNATVSTLTLTLEGGATMVSGDTYIVSSIPKGALITSCNIILEEVFNAGTSAAVNVGNAGSATAYASAKDIKTATGVIACTAGQYLESGDSVLVVPTFVGTVPTTGKMHIVFEYIEVHTLSGEYNA